LYDNLGHFAVDLFIVLSGFCLMLPVLRNGGALRGGAGFFFKKRAIRILPPYYAAMGLSLLLGATLVAEKTGTPWDASLPVTARDIFCNLFLLQNFAPHSGAINHAHWSISLEWWIYFLFPMLILLRRKTGACLATALGLAGSAILVALGLLAFGKGFTLQYVGLFALGMLGAQMATSSWRLARVTLGSVCGILSVIILGLSKYGVGVMGGAWGPVVIDYVVGGWAMCLLAYLSLSREGWACRALSARPLVFVGTFAYSIYLMHAPLLQVVWQYWIGLLPVSPLTAYFLLKVEGIPFVVAICYGFYLICERPFVQLKQQQTTGAHERPQPSAIPEPIRTGGSV